MTAKEMFKVGDKVKVVKVGEKFDNRFKKYIGKIYEIQKVYDDKYILDIEGGTFWNDCELELVPFTKSDLKDNHIVKNKKGNKQVWGNKDKKLFNNDLTSKTNDKKTIVEVYEFDKLVWKREEQILDEVEKKYLGDVIKPYDVKYIKKSGYVSENLEYVKIKVNGEFRGGEIIMLPYFKKGTMYKGMELDKEYSLKELGLE